MTRRLGIRPSDLRSAINVLLESGLKPSALDILPDGTHRWRFTEAAANRYVSRDAATKAVIRQLDAAKKRT